MKFLNSFEGLNNTTFLFEISFFSFVFGFLPILEFLVLKKKVPKFEILTTFSFSRLIKINEKNSSIKLYEICLEKPICI